MEAERLRQWEVQTREYIAQIERELRLHNNELSELRQQSITLDGKIASTEGDSDVKRWLEEQRRQLTSIMGLYQEGIAQWEAARRLREKLLAEIGAQISTVTWSERFSNIWSGVKTFWGYELTSIQDRPITVSKVVIGLILLDLGTMISRFLTRLIAGRLLSRIGLHEGAVAAIQSLLFYLLVFTVVMLSLRIVNVPLTAFTILGGALAIGVGFGSQNIVNNFISGLILLAERPIRSGDLIQIEELIGTVIHIGPRSTRVRSPENMDIIVPNSSFLEKNVVNWTLTDDRFRAKVAVGVVYGSPTRDAARLIRKAVEEHGRILDKPEPIILFSDFGDSALIFEVHFWIRMRKLMDRRIIESDLRYRIDGLFKEAGIVIAFPQRDVHLDTAKPLEVFVKKAVVVPEDEDKPS